MGRARGAHPGPDTEGCFPPLALGCPPSGLPPAIRKGRGWGTGRCNHPGSGLVSQDRPAWPWGTSSTAQEPAGHRASLSHCLGSHDWKSQPQVRAGPGMRSKGPPGLSFPSAASRGSWGHAPPSTAASVPGKGLEGGLPRACGQERMDSAPGKAVGQACSYPEPGLGAEEAAAADGAMQTPRPQAPRTPPDSRPARATQHRLPPPHGQGRGRTGPDG